MFRNNFSLKDEALVWQEEYRVNPNSPSPPLQYGGQLAETNG